MNRRGVPRTWDSRRLTVELAGHERGTHATCPTVLFSLDPGHNLYPLCQRKGQLVGRNSWWVYVDGPRGNRGWVASWFLTCPTPILPGVDECTAERLED